MSIKQKNLISAVAYLRYSDNRQDGNHSLEIQKKQILLFAERNGIVIVKWCIDKSTSAFSGRIESRKGMNDLLLEIQNGIEAVVFYEESRLTRKITDFYFSVYVTVKEEFPNIRFFSTNKDGEWDPNDPITQAKFVFASEESELKSSRAKDTHLDILTGDKPLRPGSRSPVGYDMMEGILIPNNDLNVVLLIYYLSVWGHSHKAIAAYLNNANIVTNKITSWHSSSIGYILNNVVYEGILQWRNNQLGLYVSKDAHHPLVGATLLYLSKQSTSLKKIYGKMDTPFLFRDLLVCNACKSKLIAKDNSPRGKSKQYLCYRCDSCKKTVNVEVIHNAVFKELTLSISNQKEILLKNAYSKLYDYKLHLHELNETVLNQLDAHHEKVTWLSNSKNLNKDGLLDFFNESIAYFTKQQAEYVALIEVIDGLLHDSTFDKTLNSLLQSHIYTLSNTEKRMFSLSFINEIQIDFQKDCALTIDFRLTPFVTIENLLVEKPN